MSPRRLIIFLIALFNITVPFSQSPIIHLINESIPISNQFGYDEGVYVVERDIHLQQRQIITLPENSVLRFNGGIIDNATIVGNNTKIEAG